MELPKENVQDYPRPPIVESVPQQVRVVHDNVTIIETTRALRVLETHHAPTYYLPIEEMNAELIEVPGSTLCEWKGAASYFDVTTGTAIIKRAGWTYPSPRPRFEQLKDCIALYATKFDACFVGNYRVLPQAGDFYGGWQTANLEGMVKGARGTEHW